MILLNLDLSNIGKIITHYIITAIKFVAGRGYLHIRGNRLFSARNQYIAHVFHYECEKRNVKVIYAKVPETGEGIDMMVRSIMQAFDQFHGLMSKEKGLANLI